jgi:hypothetical protein
MKDGLLDDTVDKIAIGPNNEKWFVHRELGLTKYVDVPPVSVGKTDVRPFADIPLTNHPNPFNPSTTIEYTLSEASKVRLTVYSLTGQRVATLADEYMPAGKHAAVFDGSGLASGLYFYRLEAGNTVKNGRMMLVK